MTDERYSTATAILGNPVQDGNLTEEEREFARDVLHRFATMIRQTEDAFSQFCQFTGVPEDVCMRVMIQVQQHRTATNGAHLLAMNQASDEAVTNEVKLLAARLKEALLAQIPLSRETDKRTRPSTQPDEARHGG